jgi:ATP-dependent Clp protease ATP-binding subunit ClpB
MTHLLCLNATVSQIELESLKNETDIFSRERKARVEQTLEDRRKKAADLTSIWHAGESGLRPGVFE